MLLLPRKSGAYLEPNFIQEVCPWLFMFFLNHFHHSFSSCTRVTTKHRKSQQKAGPAVASCEPGGGRKCAQACWSHCGATAEGICRRHLAFSPLRLSSFWRLQLRLLRCQQAEGCSGKLGSSRVRCAFNSSSPLHIFSAESSAGAQGVAQGQWNHCTESAFSVGHRNY